MCSTENLFILLKNKNEYKKKNCQKYRLNEKARGMKIYLMNANMNVPK